MRTSKNMKSIHDSAARGAYKAKRRRSAEVSLGRQIQLEHGHLERLDRELAELSIERELEGSVFVDYLPAPRPRLFALDAPELRAGGRLLARGLRADVARESRIHLAGPNGAGKSTLLGQLVGGASIDPERLLFLPQELDEAEGSVLLEELHDLPPEQRGRRLAILSALGVEPEALLLSVSPSPGEARKLALAQGLHRQVWALILDEPTNHLDLPSIERLERALAHYPGALVLATHDEAFASRLTDTQWRLEDGRLRVRLSAP